ncbi:MAG: MurR/RpiR family transcriptional regulator [Chloroflexi bacterium]|nr:MurR/RpiR family transcriptional regulator [Chloroflexota bacterium]MBV9897253.1 MurR/RpiR family transcriptional regulator [Chloroflexota bacterium]
MAASLQDVVNHMFEQLSPKQQRVARFLAANEVMVAFTPASELALRLEVDPATVVRLARSLGFQGYPDLQRHLRARFPHHYPALADSRLEASDSGLVARAFAQDHENLRAGQESLDSDAFDQSVELIGRAERILLFGGGVATGLVYFLGSSLRTMGFPVHYAATDGIPVVQELISLTPRDLAFGIGFYRYVGQTVRILERARALGVPRVALTDSPLSPLVRLADYPMCAPVESVSHRVSLVAPMAVANALVAACATRYSRKVGEALKRLDEEYRAAGLLTEA